MMNSGSEHSPCDTSNKECMSENVSSQEKLD